MNLKRPMPYLVTLILGVVTYWMAGGCLREDASQAEKMEEDAEIQELLADRIPIFSEEESNDIINEYRDSLTQWQNDPISSRWLTEAVIPPLPDDTVLLTLSYGAPEVAPAFTHSRTIYFEASAYRRPLTQTESDEGFELPEVSGRFGSTQQWILDWNARPEVHVTNYTVNDNGTFEVSAVVWFRDAPLECETENANPDDCITPEPPEEETEDSNENMNTVNSDDEAEDA